MVHYFYMRLIKIDPQKRMYRYYEISIQATLFEPFAVLCTWGSLVSAFRCQRIIPAKDLAEAELMAGRVLRKKLKRGYVAMPTADGCMAPEIYRH